jgi:phosphoglucomutase
MSIEDILTEHWKTYGRNYFTRYDYEECDSNDAGKMMAHLEETIADPKFVGKEYSAGGKTYKVKQADNFSYVDPIDKSVTKNQVSDGITSDCLNLARSDLGNSNSVRGRI